MHKLAIIGASGHGKVVADIALKLGYDTVHFFDDDERITECAGFPVIGKLVDFDHISDGYDFFIAIGNADVRAFLQKALTNKGRRIVTLVHPNACISRRVRLGLGSVVMAGAVINSDTTIGCGCIINTGATVDHDCCIGDFVHVSVGAHLAGTVSVGNRTWIGAGAVVSNNVSICSECMVGSGAVVVHDIVKPGTYIGVPAKPAHE